MQASCTFCVALCALTEAAGVAGMLVGKALLLCLMLSRLPTVKRVTRSSSIAPCSPTSRLYTRLRILQDSGRVWRGSESSPSSGFLPREGTEPPLPAAHHAWLRPCFGATTPAGDRRRFRPALRGVFGSWVRQGKSPSSPLKGHRRFAEKARNRGQKVRPPPPSIPGRAGAPPPALVRPGPRPPPPPGAHLVTSS